MSPAQIFLSTQTGDAAGAMLNAQQLQWDALSLALRVLTGYVVVSFVNFFVCLSSEEA